MKTSESPLSTVELRQLEALSRRMVRTARPPGWFPDGVSGNGKCPLWEDAIAMVPVIATELVIWDPARQAVLLRERHWNPEVEETFDSTRERPLLHIPGMWGKVGMTRQEMANRVARADAGLQHGVRLISPMIAEHIWPSGSHPVGHPVSGIYVAESRAMEELPADGVSLRDDGFCKLRWVKGVPPREAWTKGPSGDFHFRYLEVAFEWLQDRDNPARSGLSLDIPFVHQ